MEWIKTSERLPQVGIAVLCYRIAGGIGGYKPVEMAVGVIFKEGSDRFSCEMDWVSVTHWTPLPEKPKY